jgi:hypothetical protein
MDISSTIIYVTLIASGTIIAIKFMDFAFQILVLRMKCDRERPPFVDKETKCS